MTKALLQIIKAEFEHTDADIKSLCEKYNCTTKELSGYTKWTKTLLQPTNNTTNTDTYVKLIYETIYKPELIVSEDEPHLEEETVEAEVVEDEKVTKDIVHATAEKLLNRQPVSKADIPTPLKDSFEGLRKLDIKLQEQSLRILDTVETLLLEVETAKDLRDLAAVHTSIRDVYFNTKAPMINILNGDVNMGQQNELATLLDGVADDC